MCDSQECSINIYGKGEGKKKEEKKDEREERRKIKANLGEVTGGERKKRSIKCCNLGVTSLFIF